MPLISCFVYRYIFFKDKKKQYLSYQTNMELFLTWIASWKWGQNGLTPESGYIILYVQPFRCNNSSLLHCWITLKLQVRIKWFWYNSKRNIDPFNNILNLVFPRIRMIDWKMCTARVLTRCERNCKIAKWRKRTKLDVKSIL